MGTGFLACSREWEQILATVQRLVPIVAGIVCYGSNAWGRDGSDYDVLLVLDGHEVKPWRALSSTIQDCTGLPVDVNVVTANTLRNMSRFNPYLWHALATGYRIGNVPKAPRSLTRDGVRLAVLHVELMLEEAERLRLDANEREPWLEFAAKTMAVVEQSLSGKADGPSYARRVNQLILEDELRKALEEVGDAIGP